MIGCICKLYNELLLIRLIVYFFMCSYFPYKISGKNTYVIYEKHVRTFRKNMYVFSEKDVHVFRKVFRILCGLIQTRRKMDYIAHTLPNGLRMVHLPVNSPGFLLRFRRERLYTG